MAKLTPQQYVALSAAAQNGGIESRLLPPPVAKSLLRRGLVRSCIGGSLDGYKRVWGVTFLVATSQGRELVASFRK